MTTGEKIAKYRKENNMTQEQFADLMQVSRQAVSKWESDLVFPETDKLLRLSELFDCTVDHLLKENAPRKAESSNDSPTSERTLRVSFSYSNYEYVSRRTVGGLPLVHVCFDRKKTARGIIAVGFRARGILSLGLLSLGVLSFGVLSLGLFAFGVLALGLLAFGSLSAGIFSFGAIALGLLTAMGGIAIGSFACGGVAVGNYFAWGGSATAKVAIGLTHANGSVWSFCGEIPTYSPETVIEQIRNITPTILHWLADLMRFVI